MATFSISSYFKHKIAKFGNRGLNRNVYCTKNVLECVYEYFQVVLKNLEFDFLGHTMKESLVFTSKPRIFSLQDTS